MGYDIAIVHLELGDEDRAFEALESALSADASNLQRLRLDPTAAPLRAHLRYGEVLRRLGLE